MAAPQRCRRAPTALWRWLTDGVLVLGVDADDAVAVTGPAAELWDLLREPTTLADAAATLAARHDAGAETVRADLEQVWRRWEADGAIERA